MTSLDGETGFAAGLKKITRPIGYLLTVLALIYLVTIIVHFDWNVLNFKNPFKAISYMLLFGVWASLFIFIGAYNWKLILEFINGSYVATKDVFQVYLKSNVAKYLPGNIMHYAGRNYLGNKLGWKNSEVAFSSLLEFIFGAGTTGIVIIMFIAVGLINMPPQFTLTINFHKILAYSAIGVTVGLVVIVLIYVYRYVVRKERAEVTSTKLWNRAKRFFTRGFLVLAFKLFLISLFCFLLNSLFYFYLCELVLDFHIKSNDIFNVYAALGIANYSSIITPGVPSGFGVKESVSFLLISAYGYPKELLMVSILAYRIVCILGDFLAFGIAFFWVSNGVNNHEAKNKAE